MFQFAAENNDAEEEEKITHFENYQSSSTAAADSQDVPLNLEEIVQDHESLTDEQNDRNVKKGRKRLARVDEWLSIKAKFLRNTGQAYVSRSKSKKTVPARALKPPCDDNFKMKCSSKIDEENRKTIFPKYWELGNITLQRNFISNSTRPIVPAFRFSGKEKPRNFNNAYYFHVATKIYGFAKNFYEHIRCK